MTSNILDKIIPHVVLIRNKTFVQLFTNSNIEKGSPKALVKVVAYFFNHKSLFFQELFKSRQRLSEPIAANYFTVEYDPFVENITPVCHGPNSRPTLA